MSPLLLPQAWSTPHLLPFCVLKARKNKKELLWKARWERSPASPTCCPSSREKRGTQASFLPQEPTVFFLMQPGPGLVTPPSPQSSRLKSSFSGLFRKRELHSVVVLMLEKRDPRNCGGSCHPFILQQPLHSTVYCAHLSHPLEFTASRANALKYRRCHFHGPGHLQVRV